MSFFKKHDLGKYSIFLVLVAVVLVASFVSPNFSSPENIINIIRQVTVVTIMAYGTMMLIIAGHIDLSSGAVMALSGVAATLVYKEVGSITIAVLAAIVVGMLCNLVSGFFVATFNTPAFIITLGMMMVARGAVLELTQGQNVLQLGSFVKLGQGMIGPIPIPAIFLVIVTILVWYVLRNTRFGRSVYAVGGSAEASKAAGINISAVTYKIFVFNGALVGLAGAIFMARVNAGLPNAGVGFELQAITAPIIGGTSFSGGIGTAIGTLIGALIVGVLNNIMNLVGIGSYVQQMVMGAIIALAVTYDVWSKRGKKRRSILAHKDGPAAPPKRGSEPKEQLAGSSG